jgi:hypothetical protein
MLLEGGSISTVDGGYLFQNTHSQVTEADGRTLFKAILRRDFVRLDQDRVQCWDLLFAEWTILVQCSSFSIERHLKMAI